MEALSFDALRPWEGEQSRAFEELTFQLLKNDAPEGSRAIRTGNPDGGVEWYATLADGAEWDWQAKHVKGIDNLLTAMTGSVKRVARERPDLRRLTFVISWNLATGTQGGERKSQRQKYNDKIRSWQQSIKGADLIQFELVQGSDLLDRLSQPAHAGRIWFWWGEVVFGKAWLEQRYREESAAAGGKYRPDLQVDIPIQDDLLALGFDSSSLEKLDRLKRALISAAADVSLSTRTKQEPTATLCAAGDDCVAELKATAKSLVLLAANPSEPLRELLARADACNDAISALDEHERQLEQMWREVPEEEREDANKPRDRMSRFGVQSLRQAIDELKAWLVSSSGHLLQRRNYVLTGPAGAGKTHLLLDATRRALDDGRPAMFLSGARFGRGDLWASVSDQMGLPPIGADVLLGAMDAAGEAASIVGCRFVFFIDALNETTPPDFWTTHLPALRSRLEQYPHVALVVSCRDTYRDLVFDETEWPHYFNRAHPGFAEREIEAAQRYFAHYGLEVPRIPLLTPEFTLPLFLRLYCESMADAALGEPLTGHQSRITVFERYLSTKLSTIARRYRPASSSAYEVDAAKRQLRGALDALLDQMSRTGREGMTMPDGEAAVTSVLAGTGGDAVRVVGLFQEEGILTRERLYLGDGKYEEGLRIVFQAFSDFLLLQRRVDLSADPLSDTDLRTWLADECSWGITEAATMLFPERFHVELPDLLETKLLAPPVRDDTGAWKRHQRTRNLYRSLVVTLPYRDSGAITQRTIDLLNEAQRYISRDDFYSILFMIAPQPNNRLNGEGLHRYLSGFPMPRRDSDFGFATYSALSDGLGPAARLARWAVGGPYPTYDPEVIELACIPLCWLLSSPNRFMRDWVTKALVQLLRGHLDVMRALVERFWVVDDPYIVQRVVAVAYGSLLRSRPSQATEAKSLAESVHALVFTAPVRADELLLDSARGIVRWAVGHELLAASVIDSLVRPYGITAPGSPPLEASLKEKYGRHDDQPIEESYASIFYSLFGMGDFGRYVVESGLHHFSRYRLGRARPEGKDRQPRFVKTHWQRFLRSLSENQRADLAEHLKNSHPFSMSALAYMRRRDTDPLTEEQRGHLDSVWVHPKHISDEYPAERARRWVFRRTLSLGWTPEIFGKADRNLGHGRGREGHKAERWGKKYQWMAYHELLARIADNYQASQRYGDSRPYEGLHQITGEREIDPSLPPVDFKVFSEGEGLSATTAWEKPPITLRQWPTTPIDFKPYGSDIRRFLADTGSEPTVVGTITARDSHDEEWIILDGWMTQVDPAAEKSWRGIQQKVVVDTLLVPSDQAADLVDVLSGNDHSVVSDLVDSHGHIDCCFVGEVGRVGPDCHNRHSGLRPTTIDGKVFRIVPTVEGYCWEGSILDCSIEESATTILPSSFIQRSAALSLDMGGPSWPDPAGNAVFTHYERPGRDGRALLVRSSFLRKFLADQGLELLVVHWFERMELTEDYSRAGSHPYVEANRVARLDHELALHEGAPRRTERDLEDPSN